MSDKKHRPEMGYDTAYYRIDGKPVTLDKLCRFDPAWAVSRIRVMMPAYLACAGIEDPEREIAFLRKNSNEYATSGRARAKIVDELAEALQEVERRYLNAKKTWQWEKADDLLIPLRDALARYEDLKK